MIEPTLIGIPKPVAGQAEVEDIVHIATIAEADAQQKETPRSIRENRL